MAFNPEPLIERTPTEIRSLEVTLWDSLYEDDHPEGKKWAHAEVRVDDEHGQPMNWVRVDLANHLTPAQITQLVSFMDLLRTKAEEEILP